MASPPAPQKTASRVSRPAARYRPGKAPLGASIDDYSDSDESDHSAADGRQASQQDDVAARVTDFSSGASALLNTQQRKTAGIIINEAGPSSKKFELRLNPASTEAHTSHQYQGQEESSEYETDTDGEADAPAPARPVFRKPGSSSAVAPQPPAHESGSSSEYETDSEEGEDGEEDETSSKPLLKPIFVPKRARTTIPTDTTDTPATVEQEAETKAEQRRNEAHDLAAATIQRSLLEKQSRSESNLHNNADIDDTDGLDPEAEFEAWRQRELSRLQRDHQLILEKQKEQQEIETFKSLPEAEKERLGRERAAQLRAEKKEQKGNPAFMQKYYHKGSFFQDMDILQRDYTEKTTKEVDVSKLPKMMQVRNYGVKGRSKWTHLANEDTSKQAMKLDVPTSPKPGCFACGGPHLRKDCPAQNATDGAGSGSGANSGGGGGGGEGSRRWGETPNKQHGNQDKERRSKRDRSQSPARRESPTTSTTSRSRYDRDERIHAKEPSDTRKMPTPTTTSSASSRTHDRERHTDDLHRHRRRHRDTESRSHKSSRRDKDQDQDQARDLRKHPSSSSSRHREDDHHHHRHRSRHDDDRDSHDHYRHHRSETSHRDHRHRSRDDRSPPHHHHKHDHSSTTSSRSSSSRRKHHHHHDLPQREAAAPQQQLEGGGGGRESDRKRSRLQS